MQNPCQEGRDHKSYHLAKLDLSLTDFLTEFLAKPDPTKG